MRGMARGSLRMTAVPCPDKYRRTQAVGGEGGGGPGQKII